MITYENDKAERVVFHYNKAHNKDTSIPTWVVKSKGDTFYVHHLESSVGFRTKETPDSEHTKGSLQFKGKLKLQEEDGVITAYIS